MNAFSFIPTRNLEGDWQLVVPRFQAYTTIIETIDDNANFTVSTPGYCLDKRAENVEKLNESLDLKSQNDFELQLLQVEDRELLIEIG